MVAKKKKKYNYYKLNVGFFPDIVKLCFDDKVFQQILKDHDVTLKANALDSGIAETHLIGDGKDAIIILVFDMSLVNDNLGELVDTITHEVSHAVDHLAEHIGEEDNFVHETRAYLSGHLAGQIFKICMHEKEKYARKTSRKVSNKKSQGAGRTELQVDQLSVGSAGPNSVPQQPSTFSGVENSDGGFESAPDPSV
jgi:hypothetical protein